MKPAQTLLLTLFLPSVASAGGLGLSVTAPDARRGETSEVRVTLDVPGGHWLVAAGASGTPLRWTLDEAPASLGAGDAVLPRATPHGGAQVHTGKVVAKLPVTPPADAVLGEHILQTTLSWQMCNPDFCASSQSQAIPIPVKVLEGSPDPKSTPIPVR